MAALPLHTNGSVIFASLPGDMNMQPAFSTPQSIPAPYLCCPLLSCFEYMHCWTCPCLSWASPFSPSKLPLHAWGSGPHLIRGSFAAVHKLNSILIGSAIFAGLTVLQTDQQTDHATLFVAIGHI